MVKIAVELERAVKGRATSGMPGHLTSRVLAQGDGWTAADVLCTSGPRDRSFEEQHSSVCIAIVVAGSFQYRARSGSGISTELMTPGSLLLGNPGQAFQCGHRHGEGDRCLSFRYAPEYFEQLAAAAGVRHRKSKFHMLRLPSLSAFSPLIAQACIGLATSAEMPWEQLGIQFAAQTLQTIHGLSSAQIDAASNAPPAAIARVTRIARTIERRPSAQLPLSSLAREAGLSSYHFLRTFEHLTGMTPHQYILRARLREAAIRLAAEPAKILDIAFDCGFGDVSNFNRAFRAEFGISPRVHRGRTGIAKSLADGQQYPNGRHL